ncbi:Hematopoietic stem/progenitor cell protein 172 [Intoshia linei]|uniref:Trafficking protein particle complex subunit n=1 Tax=Intoshia linei TaxID=1819745 RepID=A0A177B1R9_9BILA|nr:Hematopoietic stem/progenitor cell protein 172 [Intoshia linei]
MKLYYFLIINRSGSLIYNKTNFKDKKTTGLNTSHDSTGSSNKINLRTHTPPIPFFFEFDQKNRILVNWGSCQGVSRGYELTQLNELSIESINKKEDGKILLNKIERYVSDISNFPCDMTFKLPSLDSNDKIVLSSMLNSFYNIAISLSPTFNCTTVSSIKTSKYKIHIYQSNTGNWVCDPEGLKNPYSETENRYENMPAKNFISI